MADWLDVMRLGDDLFDGVTGAMSRWIGSAPGSSVLDAGCGAGGLVVHLARAVGTAGRVGAVDEDGGAVAATWDRVTRAGLTDRVDVAEGDILDPATAPGPYDLVVGRSVVHHFADVGAGVGMLAQRARSGGRIIVGEGGLPTRFLPYDLGIGEPGLSGRLEVANNRRFEAERRDLGDPIPMEGGWRRILLSSGVTDVSAKTFLMELVPPLDDDDMLFVYAMLERNLEPPTVDFVAEEDRETLRRLLKDQPSFVERLRHDLHFLGAATLWSGTVPAPTTEVVRSA